MSTSLTIAQAHLLALFFASSFVGSLYVSKRTRLAFREHHERWRDDHTVIRARLVACTVSTTICVFTVAWVHSRVLGSQNGLLETAKATAHRLGLTIHPSWTSLTSLLITPLLFTGPLYAMYISATLPFMYHWSFHLDVVDKFFTWQGIRNYIVAPITEEIVFRACVLAVYDLAGASRRGMTLFTPLSFGLAHVHHAWETFNKYGRTSNAAKRAVVNSLVQLTYTTLFGAYCAYLFLRTGSIFPPISAHAFCNVMGLPELRREMGMFPSRKYMIVVMYLVGVTAFANRLRPWTKSEYSIYWI
ncbi:hypothetical protein APHAL10511_005484 [Amanita phalloides]|nr:hypothetical protein APHAL10511_005484 [Amanita phalloides]